MNRYQLATLVKWAGTLQTRKRLQKVVYLLQASGYALNAKFTLHHYGPYSQDVARLADEMVQMGLLCETEAPIPPAGASFSYQLSESVEQRLGQGPVDQERLGILGNCESLAKRLLAESDLRKLEFAATIAYFHAKKPDLGWGHARQAAASFKRQDVDSDIMQESEKLAREVVGEIQSD